MQVTQEKSHKRSADGNFYCSKHKIALKKRPIKGRYFCEECPEGEGEFLITSEYYDSLLSAPEGLNALERRLLNWQSSTYLYKVECVTCGIEFKSQNCHAKYCSVKCRKIRMKNLPISRVLNKMLGASLD